MKRQNPNKSHKHEHGCEHEHDCSHEHDGGADDGCGCGHAHGELSADAAKGKRIRLLIGAALYLPGLILHLCGLPLYWTLPFFVASYCIVAYDVLWPALKNLLHGKPFDEAFLMSLASLGAFAIGEYPEAVAVMLLYQVGEYLQDLAVARSKRSISALLDIRPDTATVLRDGAAVTVAPDTVAIGEELILKAGERVPLDGVILSGDSALDTAALTGESAPRTVHGGDEVLSGSVNLSGVLHVRVTRTFGDSTASRTIDLVRNAASHKAASERFLTRFSRWYTPTVVILAAALTLVPWLVFGQDPLTWLKRSFVLLVISCPCALVISVPLTFFGGLGAASKKGVLIKGGNYLEALTHVETVVFDKTGTLTEGVFAVRQILPATGISEDALLALAAAAEGGSNHPIAASIRKRAGVADNILAADAYSEIAGRGVEASVGGSTLLAGNEQLMQESGVSCPAVDAIGTKVYLAENGQYRGCIVIADALKADSAETIQGLRRLGVQKLVMLTGDDRTVAEATAKALALDDFAAELLPADKVACLDALHGTSSKKGKLLFVGDGVNDAPVLARADVGVAMGALGSDAAIEAADVVLMTDEPKKLLTAIAVAKATHRIVVQNVVFALSVKVCFLVLGALGLAGMWIAVVGDVGVMLLAVLNAMRVLKK